MSNPEHPETETAEGIAHKIVWDLTREIVPCHIRDLDALKTRIAEIIQSERASASRQVAEALERAAKVADKWAQEFGVGDNDWCRGQRLAATEIARKQRSLIPTKDADQ